MIQEETSIEIISTEKKSGHAELGRNRICNDDKDYDNDTCFFYVFVGLASDSQPVTMPKERSALIHPYCSGHHCLINHWRRAYRSHPSLPLDACPFSKRTILLPGLLRNLFLRPCTNSAFIISITTIDALAGTRPCIIRTWG